MPVTPKWVPWPGIGQVNIREISPIVDDFYFRRLSDKGQLGLCYLVFPGATHDRRQHAMGTHILAREFASRMMRLGILMPYEAHNIGLLGLVHDIGHGPFSHVIEALTTTNHEKYGIKILDKMADAIRACGGDAELIKSYMRGDNPAGKIIMDENFGMDKLDYLVRDQEATEFGPDIRHCVESVFNHLIYHNGELMVDLKALDAAIEIQRAYIYFYRNVHLEKSAYLIQRFMQKLMYQLLQTPKEEGGITEDELWEMVDGDVIHTLKKCRNETVRNGIIIFDRGVKHFPKTALSIRVQGYEWLERRAGKPIHVVGVEKEFFDRFFERSRAGELERVETEIAGALGVESWEVIVSHIVEKSRFVPEDVKFFDGPRVYSLKEQDPRYFSLLGEEMDKYLCVRVCIAPEHRQILFERWREAFEIVCNYVGFKPSSL